MRFPATPDRATTGARLFATSAVIELRSEIEIDAPPDQLWHVPAWARTTMPWTRPRRSGTRSHFCRVLQVDAELAQLDDRRSAPADRVGRERQRERHPVRFAERLALAQDAVVPGRRFDREAERLEPADELANVLPHLGS